MEKIAVIEDDSGIRTVIRLALKGAGLGTVCEAERGDDGLELVVRERPSLVLLDLMLPGMDGLDVCREIRRTPSVATTPVVMLTAKSAEEDVVRPQASRSGIEITTFKSSPSPSSSPLMRSCDPRLIESAVANLVQNAIRHSGTKTIEVILESRSDGRAEIRVADHGVGIPADCQARIFERFYRVDKDRSRALGGTGLGLAIVKHIAQLHGGEVSVVSKSGEGATFIVVF